MERSSTTSYGRTQEGPRSCGAGTTEPDRFDEFTRRYLDELARRLPEEGRSGLVFECPLLSREPSSPLMVPTRFGCTFFTPFR